MSDDRLRTPPAERFAGEHAVFDLPAEAAALEAERGSSAPSSTHGHRQKTLYKHGGRTVALFVLEAGGSLVEHAANGIVTVQAIEGEIEMSIGGQTNRLTPRMMVVLAPGVRHDVRARARAVFLLQVSLTAS